MIKRLVLALALIAIIDAARAQNIEFGILLGASNYYGDLSNESIMPSQTHPSGAIIGRYNINERWSVKGYLGYGRISGADSLGSSDYRKVRNLSFYSDIYEVSLQFEWNMIRNISRFNGGHPMVPFLFGGIGVFNFNPSVDFRGRTWELQPLGTEGQGSTQYNDRRKYYLTQLCIPAGIGFKKKVSSRFTVGLEVGARITFTGYLDDVSGTYADARVVGATHGEIAQALSNRTGERNPAGFNTAREGDPRGFKYFPIPDMYFMGGISLSYVFKNPGLKCPRF
jgi:hypothetical protein